MKIKKRFLSILLSLALILGLMPGMSLTAYAYEGNPYTSLVNTTTDISIYPIVIKLFKEYGFNRIRRAPNINVDMKRALIRLPYTYAVSKAGIYTTDYLGNFYGIQRSNFQFLNSTIEIMCHPQKKNGVDYIDGVAGLLLKDYLWFLQEDVNERRISL